MELAFIGSIAGTISFCIHTAQGILQIINHTRCRSKCLGKEMDISLDVDNTSPLISKLKAKSIVENGTVPGHQTESPGFSQGK